MLGINADHADHTLAVDDLALITHLLYRRSHFHYTTLKGSDALLITVGDSSPIKIVG